MLRRRSKSMSNLASFPTAKRKPLIPVPSNNLKRTGLMTEGPAEKNRKIVTTIPSTITSKVKSTTTTNRTGLAPINGTRSAQLPKLVENKTTKLVVPSKATLSKPAPLDFKARWQILHEKHIALSTEHKEVSKKYQELSNQVTKYVDIQDKFTELQLKYDKLQILCDNQNEELTTCKTNLNACTSELEIVKSQLHITTNALNVTEADNKALSHKNKELETNLEISEKQNRKLSELLLQSDTERRKLQNLVQDLKGNIRVFCRVRPVLEGEKQKLPINVNYVDESMMEVHDPTQKLVSKQEFVFDRVFSPSASQEFVFEELGQLIESALDGYNVCVFAYGQTGSGKTFTMEGNRQIPELAGMIPRTADLIFKSIEARRLIGWDFEVQISFLEIYNEHIIDLLNNSNKKENYEIRMVDPKGSDLYVTNLKIEKITSSEQVLAKLATAQDNRAVAATTMNAHSSRSHCVGKIYLTGLNKQTNEKCISSLSLVDLAGSERIQDTTDQIRLTETKNINKSLANLGNVILALSQKNKHVPYRNSKLTHLLMPSLGGSSKMLMFVNVSPLVESYNETLNSLRFASKVNCTKIGKIKKNKVQTVFEN